MHMEHVIDIAAPVETVWDLTVDIERWPALMPTITRVERLDGGPLAVGSRARLKQPAQRPTVWTVTTMEPHARFVWEAKVAGVATAASHRLEATPTGCRNTLVIDTCGRGARLLALVAGRRIRATLATENDRFKTVAEARVQPGSPSPTA
jgi:uncharacterized membrane protein